MRLTRLFAATIFISTLCLASATMASTIDFQTPSGLLGASQAYTFPGTTLTITASGFCSGPDCSMGAKLFGKTNGGDENGLGLASDPSLDNEIFYKPPTVAFIQIDVSNLLAQGVTSIQFSMGSVTAGETWQVFGCGTTLVLCNNSLTGIQSDEFPTIHTLNGLTTGTEFLDFVSEGTPVAGAGNAFGNVLIHNMSAVPAVPEPASMALFGSGLLGLAGVIRRKIIK